MGKQHTSDLRCHRHEKGHTKKRERNKQKNCALSNFPNFVLNQSAFLALMNKLSQQLRAVMKTKTGINLTHTNTKTQSLLNRLKPVKTEDSSFQLGYYTF